VRAVEDLSFRVRRGELVALLGPNGAGKSTTLRMLVGYQVPTRGRVRLRGHDVFREGRAARASLGYLPENPGLYPEMRVVRYLRHLATLKGMGGAAARRAVERVVERWDLGDVAHRPTGQLSRGYRQRVALAQATLGDPEVLILDEPTTGLDPNQAQDLYAYLERGAEKRAVLFSTHRLAEATRLCRIILIIHRGRLIARGLREELTGPAPAPGRIRAVVEGGAEPEWVRRQGLSVEARDGTWWIEGPLPAAEHGPWLRRLLGGGGVLRAWAAEGSGLEDLFAHLTREARS
jgi:ABC-2 type transport system ATP-binding protein